MEIDSKLNNLDASAHERDDTDELRLLQDFDCIQSFNTDDSSDWNGDNLIEEQNKDCATERDSSSCQSLWAPVSHLYWQPSSNSKEFNPNQRLLRPMLAPINIEPDQYVYSAQRSEHLLESMIKSPTDPIGKVILFCHVVPMI
jgi:hypothetical protein